MSDSRMREDWNVAGEQQSKAAADELSTKYSGPDPMAYLPPPHLSRSSNLPSHTVLMPPAQRFQNPKPDLASRAGQWLRTRCDSFIRFYRAFSIQSSPAVPAKLTPDLLVPVYACLKCFKWTTRPTNEIRFAQSNWFCPFNECIVRYPEHNEPGYHKLCFMWPIYRLFNNHTCFFK